MRNFTALFFLFTVLLLAATVCFSNDINALAGSLALCFIAIICAAIVNR